MSGLLEAATEGCSFAQVLLNGKEMIFNQFSQMEEIYALTVAFAQLRGSANIQNLDVGFSIADSPLNYKQDRNVIFERTKTKLLVYASSGRSAAGSYPSRNQLNLPQPLELEVKPLVLFLNIDRALLLC